MRSTQAPKDAALPTQTSAVNTRRARVSSAPPTPFTPHRSLHSGNRTGDVLPQGSGSPPIIDFTDWADDCRGQRFDFNLPREYPSELTKKGPHTLLRDIKEFSQDGWRIEYDVLLNALQPLLDSESEGVENYLDLDEIMNVHQQDREIRARRFQFSFGDHVHAGPGIDGVMGKSLKDIFLHAATPIQMAGTEHFLPTVVVVCVEELYRTGLYQPHLFRKTPNFKRVEELIDVYDRKELPEDIRIARRRPCPPQYLSQVSVDAFGALTSLHMETTENICALLRTFLQNLPEPILSPCLFNAIWNWCGIYRETPRHGFNHSPPRMAPNCSLPPEELVRIYMAQILLHLLPTPNFSLLVYLLSFFSQVIMVREVNGLGIDDLGVMFGAILFGGASEAAMKSSISARSKPRARGDTMMRWFLRRWREIYNGLFPYDDDGRPSKSSIHAISPASETSKGSVLLTRQASEYFVLQPLPVTLRPGQPSSVDEGSGSTCASSARADDGELCSLDSALCQSERVTVSASDSSSLPRPSPGIPKSQDPTVRYIEEVWPHLSPTLRMKLNERLVDVLLEPLLSTDGSHSTRRRSNSAPLSIPHQSQRTGNPAHAQDHTIQTQLKLAHEQIKDLERSARESRLTLQDALDENQRLREDNKMLEMHVKALERETRLGNTGRDDGGKALGGRGDTVDGVRRQRDEARGIVAEIQKISGGLWSHDD